MHRFAPVTDEDIEILYRQGDSAIRMTIGDRRDSKIFGEARKQHEFRQYPPHVFQRDAIWSSNP